MEELLKVMVVDDEREIADYIGELITGLLPELDVSVLYSGPKALEALKAAPCDLLVTDIRMPVTDGFALLDYVVAASLDVEIVFLTAFKEFDYIYQALLQKPITYLVKTEREEVLLNTLGHKLREIARGRTFAGGMLQSGRISGAAARRPGLEPAETALPDADGANDVSQVAVHLVRNYIREHIEQGVSLSALADHFHYNPCYLSRAFSRVCGQKLNDYIMQCKIAAAKKYLAETDSQIGKIADRLGYQSPQAFIRFFRNKVGMSADEWRRFHARSE
jgi:YesN/AraC family two-component response regulator